MADAAIALRGTVTAAVASPNGNTTTASDATTAVGDYILVIAAVDFKTGLSITNSTGVVNLSGLAGWTQLSASDHANLLLRAWIGKATTAGARTVACTQSPGTDSGNHVHVYTLNPNGGTISLDGTPTTNQDLTTPFTHAAVSPLGSLSMLVFAHAQVQFTTTTSYNDPAVGTQGAENYLNAESGMQSCYQMLSASGSTGTRDQTGTSVAAGGGAAGFMFALRNDSTAPPSGPEPGRFLIAY